MLSYCNDRNRNIQRVRNRGQNPTIITLSYPEIKQLLRRTRTRTRTRRTSYGITRKVNRDNSDNNVYSKYLRSSSYDSNYYSYYYSYDNFYIRNKWTTFRNEVIDELLKLNDVTSYLEDNINKLKFEKSGLPYIDNTYRIQSTKSMFYSPLFFLQPSKQGNKNDILNSRLFPLKKNKFTNNIKNMMKSIRTKFKSTFKFRSKNHYTSPLTMTTSNINLLPTEQSSPMGFCASPSLGENSNTNNIYRDDIESHEYLLSNSTNISNSDSLNMSQSYTNLFYYL